MKKSTALLSIVFVFGFFLLLITSNVSAESKYIKEYNGTMHSMHKNMMVKPSGNDEIDFLRQMIPHHQGAIDMSLAILKVAKDPQVIALAKAIIVEQKKEIAQMNAMIKRLQK